MSLKLRPCLTFLKHRALWFRTPRRSCSNLEDDEKRGGFAKAFEKYTDPEFLEPKKPAQATPKQDLKFATLLRNSRLMQIGDPEGAVVTGEIYHVVGDDLYVEFGWKFPCVVRRPERNADAYVRGARVRLRIKDLELSTRFLGSPRDLTLLEADCILLGLISPPESQKVSGGV